FFTVILYTSRSLQSLPVQQSSGSLLRRTASASLHKVLGYHGNAITVGWLCSPFFLDFMAAELYALTQEALVGMEVELVDVERAPGGLLRVTIDRPDGVRIEHCERLSQPLSRVCEGENSDYPRLELRSAGVDGL